MGFWIPDNLRVGYEIPSKTVIKQNPNLDITRELTPEEKEDKRKNENLSILKSIDNHLESIEKTTNTIYSIIIVSIVITVISALFDLLFGWM